MTSGVFWSRTVLVASLNRPERDRLKKALDLMLHDRNETALYREVDHLADLLKELRSLHENLVTLVVISGFNGYWHRLFNKFTALIETEVAGILINDNAETLEVAKKHGLSPVALEDGETEVSRVAAQLLEKLTV